MLRITSLIGSGMLRRAVPPLAALGCPGVVAGTGTTGNQQQRRATMGIRDGGAHEEMVAYYEETTGRSWARFGTC